MAPVQLSSQMTQFYKKGLPTLWYSFLAIFLMNTVMSQNPIDLWLKVGVVAVLALASHFLLFTTFYSFSDEVLDEGDVLHISYKGEKIHLPLSDIKIVSYTHDSNPPKVTLTLKEDCITNKGVKNYSFMPITDLDPFKRNEKIVNLKNRVERLG